MFALPMQTLTVIVLLVALIRVPQAGDSSAGPFTLIVILICQFRLGSKPRSSICANTELLFVVALRLGDRFDSVLNLAYGLTHNIDHPVRCSIDGLGGSLEESIWCPSSG